MVLVVSGCGFGGGAYAGYGVKRGVIVGAEGGLTADTFQTNVGFDRLGHVFARLDVAVGASRNDSSSTGWTPAFRIGGGIVGSIVGTPVDTHLTGVFGFGTADVYKNTTPAGADPVCARDTSSADVRAPAAIRGRARDRARGPGRPRQQALHLLNYSSSPSSASSSASRSAARFAARFGLTALIGLALGCAQHGVLLFALLRDAPREVRSTGCRG